MRDPRATEGYVDPMAGSSVRTRAASAFEALLPSLTARATERLGRSEALAFLARLATSLLDIYEPLEVVYGSVELNDLVEVLLDAAGDRPVALRELDRRREIDPRWYQRARQVGYVCYADRFAGSLAGVADRLDYLDELGVTYLHLMPLLAARPAPNDGGYAVIDDAAYFLPGFGYSKGFEEVSLACRALEISPAFRNVINVGKMRVFQREAA
jgi:amylosucrase